MVSKNGHVYILSTAYIEIYSANINLTLINHTTIDSYLSNFLDLTVSDKYLAYVN